MQRLDAFMHQKDGGETEDCRYKQRLLKALQKKPKPQSCLTKMKDFFFFKKSILPYCWERWFLFGFLFFF